MKNEFSVLMSVYQKENPEFLEESLHSILNQTRLPKEIILVEDGPLNDKLYCVIESFSNMTNLLRRVRLVENLGLGRALSEGVEYVTTNLIARMDSDDISVKDRFEKQIALFDNHNSLALVGGQIAEFQDRVDNIISYRNVPVGDKEIRKFAKLRSPFNHPTIVMKKDVLQTVGGYQSFSYLEDYHLWVRFLLENNITVCNLSDVLLYMRVGNGLYNRRGGFKYLKQYIVLKRLFRSWKFINLFEYASSVMFMGVSTLSPVWLRKYLYTHLLRK